MSRVLHLIETLDFGGAEKVVVDLVEATRERCAPAVCCVKRSGELARRLPQDVPVIVLEQGEGVSPGLPWRVARLLRDGGFTALHSHMWGVFLTGAIAGRLAGVPVIHTVHGNYLAYGPGPLSRVKRGLRQGLERRVAPWHRRVVTVSDALGRQLREQREFPAAVLETVHNGIRDGGPAIVRDETAGLRMITVGRMAAVKNQALMLRALAALRAAHPGVPLRLDLVGDGPERPALEALAASLGLGEAVRFLGFRHQVDDLLAQADVFLLTSRYEGISIAVLEAMRAGLPVIGTAVGGMAETVEAGRTGWLVPDDDLAACVEAMRSALLDRAGRLARGEAGRQRQRDRFSMNQTAARYLGLYAGERA